MTLKVNLKNKVSAKVSVGELMGKDTVFEDKDAQSVAFAQAVLCPDGRDEIHRYIRFFQSIAIGGDLK